MATATSNAPPRDPEGAGPRRGPPEKNRPENADAPLESYEQPGRPDQADEKTPDTLPTPGWPPPPPD